MLSSARPYDVLAISGTYIRMNSEALGRTTVNSVEGRKL